MIPKDAIASFNAEIGNGYTPEEMADAYRGHWESIGDWADDFISDTNMLAGMPENLRPYFNVAQWARDCELEGSVTFTGANPRGIYVWSI